MKRLQAVNERHKKVSEDGGRQSAGGGDEGRLDRKVSVSVWEQVRCMYGGLCRFLINVWLLVRA